MHQTQIPDPMEDYFDNSRIAKWEHPIHQAALKLFSRTVAGFAHRPGEN